jgi:ribonuclease-3
MEQLEKAIEYQFKNRALFKVALTHSSYYNENRAGCEASNERMEFLGDSVLGFLTAEYLYETYKDKPEGELTRLRASLVCESNLARAAASLGVSEALLLGKGEEVTGGRHRPSLTADAMEALLAAIFLDGGLEPARRFVRRFIPISATETAVDYKTDLQEVLQRDPSHAYAYHLVDSVGPDHAKVFTVEVRLDGKAIGSGTGNSKKEAEQAAAKAALEYLSHESK